MELELETVKKYIENPLRRRSEKAKDVSFNHKKLDNFVNLSSKIKHQSTGDSKQLKLLLHEGVITINSYVDCQGENTVLSYFVSMGAPLKLINYIIKKGAGVFPKLHFVDDSLGLKPSYSLLYRACQSGRQEVVQFLLEEKQLNQYIDIELDTEMGNFWLLAAVCSNGNVQLLRYLIDRWNISYHMIHPELHRNVLYYACKHGHLEVVNYLVKQKKINIDYVDNNGDSPLFIAVKGGHIDLIHYFFQYLSEYIFPSDKASDDHNIIEFYSFNSDNCSLVYYLCLNGYTSLVKLLLQTASEEETMLVSTLQATNSSNETILHASCRSGSLDLVQFLLEETEIMQLHNLKQIYPSLIANACESGRIDLMTFLVDSIVTITSYSLLDILQLPESATILQSCCLGGMKCIKYFFEEKKLPFPTGKSLYSCINASLTRCNQLEVVKYILHKLQEQVDDGELLQQLFGVTRDSLQSSEAKYIMERKLFGLFLLTFLESSFHNQQDQKSLEDGWKLEIVKYLIEHKQADVTMVFYEDYKKKNVSNERCKVEIIYRHEQYELLFYLLTHFHRKIASSDYLHMVKAVLCLACQGSDYEFVRHILETETFLTFSEVLSVLADGTLFFAVCESGNRRLIDYLLSYLPSLLSDRAVNTQDKQRITSFPNAWLSNHAMLLYHTVRSGNMELLIDLIERMTLNIDWKNLSLPHSYSLLHVAAEIGNIPCFHYLMTLQLFDPFCVDQNGQTPFSLAYKHHRCHYFHQALLQQSVDCTLKPIYQQMICEVIETYLLRIDITGSQYCCQPSCRMNTTHTYHIPYDLIQLLAQEKFPFLCTNTRQESFLAMFEPYHPVIQRLLCEHTLSYSVFFLSYLPLTHHPLRLIQQLLAPTDSIDSIKESSCVLSSVIDFYLTLQTPFLPLYLMQLLVSIEETVSLHHCTLTNHPQILELQKKLELMIVELFQCSSLDDDSTLPTASLTTSSTVPQSSSTTFSLQCILAPYHIHRFLPTTNTAATTTRKQPSSHIHYSLDTNQAALIGELYTFHPWNVLGYSLEHNALMFLYDQAPINNIIMKLFSVTVKLTYFPIISYSCFSSYEYVLAYIFDIREERTVHCIQEYQTRIAWTHSLRSNCLACMICEFFTRSGLIWLLCMVSIHDYAATYQTNYKVTTADDDTIHTSLQHYTAYEITLLVYVLADIAYTLGIILEMDDWKEKLLGVLYEDEWMQRDVGSAMFYLGWILCRFVFPHYFSIGRVFLATAALPLLFGMLRYLFMFRACGELIMLIRAMGVELILFFIVYSIVLGAFTIVFYALYYQISDGYSTMAYTVLTLVENTLVNFDFTVFTTNDTSVNITGMILLIGFLFVTAIVMINLLIAQMSNSYEEVKDRAYEQWSYGFAKLVKQFLLIREHHAFRMIPAPFNLLTILLYPFHRVTMTVHGFSLAGTVSNVMYSYLFGTPIRVYEQGNHMVLMLREEIYLPICNKRFSFLYGITLGVVYSLFSVLALLIDCLCLPMLMISQEIQEYRKGLLQAGSSMRPMEDRNDDGKCFLYLEFVDDERHIKPPQFRAPTEEEITVTTREATIKVVEEALKSLVIYSPSDQRRILRPLKPYLKALESNESAKLEYNLAEETRVLKQELQAQMMAKHTHQEDALQILSKRMDVMEVSLQEILSILKK